MYLVSSDQCQRSWIGTAHSPAVAFSTLVRETVQLDLPSGATLEAVVSRFDTDAGDAELHGTGPATF